ncbi:MAG: heme exporter protein CcmD [Pseudomonadales bacterium]|nr:heme exporter protein CcmD [Pseudomonadales bacterium]
MYFDSFEAFLAMGKHAAYVWSAYGLGLLILSLNVILPMLNKRKVVAKQQARLRREHNKKRATSQ